jgi:myosin heavy subunit
MDAETTQQSPTGTRIALIVAIFLLIGSIIYVFIEKERRGLSEENLKAEKLKSEALLAEKLAFEKNRDEYKAELEKMTTASHDIQERAKNTESLLNQALKDLEKNKRANNNVGQLKKKLQTLQNEKAELDRQITDYKNTLEYARSSEEQNKHTIAALESGNKQFTDRVNALMKTSLDNSLVVTAKRNQKITVKAKHVKQLSLEADIIGTTDNIKMSLMDPDGKSITPDLSELTISPAASSTEKGQAFYVSNAEPSLAKSRVEIIYKPKNKLKPGIYKVAIDNGGNLIGSLQVKLR